MARPIGIRVHRGNDLVDTQVFERDIIKIGRLASAHLRLEDPKVSRIHAVIDISAGNEVSIIDMGSAEGTRVNGEKVSRTRLKHGDEVGLGDSRLVLVLDDAEVAALTGGAPKASVDERAAAGAAVSAVSTAGLAFEGGLPSHTGVFISGATDVSQLRADLAQGATSSYVPQTTDVFAMPTVEVAVAFDPSTGTMRPVAPGQPVGAPVVQPPVVQAAIPPATAWAPAASGAPAGAVAPAMAPSTAVVQGRPGGGALVAGASPAAPVLSPPRAPVTPVPGAVLPPITEDRITPENRYVEVTVRWHNDVVECKRVRSVPKLSIGKAEADDLFVPLEGVASGASWDLLRAQQGGGWYVRFTDRMAGSVSRGGQSLPLAQAGATPDGEGFSLPLTDDTAVSLTIGYFTIDVRVVPKSRIVPMAPLFDLLWANTVVVTMFGTLVALGVVTLAPVGLDSMEDDLLTNPSKFQTLILKPPPKDNSFLEKLKGPKQKQTQAAANAEGKAGDKKADPNKDKGKMAVKAKEKPSDAQVVASKFNALFGDQSGGLAQVFGEQAGGGALEAALGQLDGARVAAGHGSGGLGLRGGAPGGGGTGLNTLGTGKIGSKGRGSGQAGYGSGEGGLGGRSDRDVTMTQGTPVILGSLDKEIIRRVVQEHASQIRYCYEKELTRTPGLFGKIKMKWVINGEGKVTQAQVEEMQMKDGGPVGNCLASRIKGWVFPKPKGGGIVIVSYPFVFKQSG